MLPLQLVVFSRLPSLFGGSRRINNELAFLILLYYGTVEFVWLNFGNTANTWLPYQFYPLVVLS